MCAWIAKYLFRLELDGDVSYYHDYDYLYSSRTVIKNQYYNKRVSNGFYGVDVWKYADEIVKQLKVIYEKQEVPEKAIEKVPRI